MQLVKKCLNDEYIYIQRAKKRLDEQKNHALTPDIDRNSKTQETYRHMRGYGIHCSQIGDSRPLSTCRFSPDSKMVAISSW